MKEEKKSWFTVVNPDGSKEKAYTDKESIQTGIGEIVVDIFKAIAKAISK